MPKTKIKRIHIHAVDADLSLPEAVSDFHARVIERKLNSAALSKEEKTLLLERILVELN